MLQNFTSSRKDLESALRQLKVPSALSTLLYDAIRDCSENLMRKKAGRKAFILLSDGVDYRSRTPLPTAIEYAQRADTIIYSILFADPLQAYRPVRSAILAMSRDRGRKVMQRLAAETGGAFFEVTKSNPIEGIYTQIEDALRNQYSIGYTPETEIRQWTVSQDQFDGEADLIDRANSRRLLFKIILTKAQRRDIISPCDMS